MHRATDNPDLIPAWVDGRPSPAGKLAVHRRGLRHRAISVFVIVAGEVLIQRRAGTKYHSAGLWANTCCTHPAWGEAPGACASRRLREELGITGLAPVGQGRLEYRAAVSGGMIEHEVVEIFIATAPRRPEPWPNPAEVSDIAWIGLDRLCAEIARDPWKFTPWLRLYLGDHRHRLLDMLKAAT